MSRTLPLRLFVVIAAAFCVAATVVFAAPSGAQSLPPATAPFRSHVVPGVVEAEDFDAGPNGSGSSDSDLANVGGQYRTDTAVDIYETSGGKGYTVGRTRDGEWLEYTVDVTSASQFTASVRVASGSANPGGFELAIVGADGTLEPVGAVMANTTDWWKFETLTLGAFDLGAGRHVLRLTAVGGNVNLDRLAFRASGGPTSAVPFRTLQIPGIVEAEDFDEGGHRTSWFDTDSANFGNKYRPGKSVDLYAISGESGFAVGRTRGGEWTQYSVDMATAGYVRVAVRVASGFADPGGVIVTIDGTEVGSVDIDNTGAWWTWETIDVGAITLEPGPHVVRVEWTGNGQINFDRIEFAADTPTIATIGGVEELRAVGKNRRPTIARCPAGVPAIGVGGLVDASVTALELACGRPDGTGNSSSLQVQGTTDGVPFDERCASGEVLVGLVFRSVKEPVNGLRPICVAVSPYGNWGAVPTVAAPIGESSGKRIERRCPVNSAVTGFSARATSKIKSVTLLCQRLTLVRAGEPPTSGGDIDVSWDPQRVDIDFVPGEDREWDGVISFNDAATGTLQLTPSAELIPFIPDQGDRLISANAGDRVAVRLRIVVAADLVPDGDPTRCDVEGTITATIAATVDIEQQLDELLPVCINLVSAGSAGSRETFVDPSEDRLADGGLGRDYVVGELLVGIDLDLETPDARIDQIATAHGATVRSGISRAATYQLDFPNARSLESLDALQAQLEAEANVEFVSRVFVGETTTRIPDDPIWKDTWSDWTPGSYNCNDSGRCDSLGEGDNWNLEAMGMPEAWDLTTGDPSVRVGIIDSGFFGGSAPDIAPNVVKVTGREGLTDSGKAHGEQMAGILCGAGNNGISMTGVAWDCQLYLYAANNSFAGVRISSGGAPGLLEQMVNAVDDGVDIVSISQANVQANVNELGECNEPLDTEKLLRRAAEANDILQRGIDYALVNDRDILWVISAANACRDIRYAAPAGLVLRRPETVMTIAAHDMDFEPQRVTNFGAGVTVAAPGEQITSIDSTDTDGNLHKSSNGTSSAAPHVAGLAALVRSYNPTFSAAQIKQCIVDGAAAAGTPIVGTRISDGVPEIAFGFNSVNAPAAIRCPDAGRGVTEPSDFQVLLYDDANFAVGEDERTLRVDFPTDIPSFGAVDFNDKTSSVQWRIPEGFTLRLFEDDNFGGDELDLVGTGETEGFANLDGQSFGDKASSAQWIQTSTVPVVRRTAGPTIVGDSYQVTYEIVNDGPLDATDVVLTAPVRVGQFTSGTGANCTIEGVNPTGQRTLRCVAPTVPGGDSRQVTLSFKPTDVSYDVALTISIDGVTNNTASTVIPATNAEITLTAGPPLRSGSTYSIAYRVTNTGSLPAPTVLTIPININQIPGTPDDCSLSGTNPNGARVLRCDLGEIAVGGVGLKRVQFRVPLEGFTVEATATSARAVSSVESSIGAGSTSLSLAASAAAPSGETVNVTFTARNTGNVVIPVELSIALNVNQLAEVPSDCSLRGVNPDGNRTLICDLRTLGAGGTTTQEISFRGFVDAYSLTAQATGPDAAASTRFTIPANAVAGVSLTQIAGPTAVDGDFEVGYRLSNAGRLTSLEVSLTAGLQAGQYVSSTGTTCTVIGVNPNGDRTLRCVVPPISPGQTVDFVIRFNGQATAYPIALVGTTDTAQIGTVTTTIPAGTVGLNLSATDPSPSGDNYDVTFTASNTGTVVVPAELTIPLNISQLAVSPSGCTTEGTNPNGDRILRCDLGTISAGGSATQGVTFRSQEAPYSLTARIDGSGQSSSASFTIPALPAVGLVLTRISGPAPTGGDFTVGYRVRNNGGLSATDVKVTAPLQAGQYVAAQGAACVVSGVNPNGARTLSCDIDDVASGAAREFTITFNGELASYETRITVTNAGTAFNTVTTTIPSGTVALGLTAGTPTLSGDNYAVLFRATNSGTISAPVDLTVPLNISQLVSTPAGCQTEGTNPNGDRILRCDLGTIGAGGAESQVVLFRSQAAPYTINARVDGNGESASAEFTIPSLPRVVVSVVGAPNAAGQVRLSMRNAGGGTVANYVLSGGLRAGQFQSGDDCTVTGVTPDGARTLRCVVGELPSDGGSVLLDLDFATGFGAYVVLLRGNADGVAQDDNVIFTIPD